MTLTDIQSKVKQSAEERDRTRKAWDLIHDRFPELCDRNLRPCSYAVWALLSLWREHGEGHVTRRMLVEAREVKVQGYRDRMGYDPLDRGRAA